MVCNPIQELVQRFLSCFQEILLKSFKVLAKSELLRQRLKEKKSRNTRQLRFKCIRQKLLSRTTQQIWSSSRPLLHLRNATRCCLQSSKEIMQYNLEIYYLTGMIWVGQVSTSFSLSQTKSLYLLWTLYSGWSYSPLVVWKKLF